MSDNSGGTGAYLLDISALLDEAAEDLILSRLPEEKRDKCRTLVSPLMRTQSLGAWLLLDTVLAQRGIALRREKLAYNEYGKPYLALHSDIRFNLSHAGKWALCCISPCEVGCDIEETGRIKPNVVWRCFEEREQQAVRTHEALADEIWVRKESFVKCIGQGMAIPFSAFSVCENKELVPRISFEGETYRIVSLRAPEGFRAALCLKAADFITDEFVPVRIDPKELFK